MTTAKTGAEVLAEINRRNMAARIDPLEYPQAACTFCGSDAFETPLMHTGEYGFMCIDGPRCARAQDIPR